MMEIEKKFAQMDLSSIKELPLKMFVKGCWQYQNFSTKKALERIDYSMLGWSDKFAHNQFDAIVAYIKYGSCSTFVTQNMKKYLEEIIHSNKYVPLVPSKADRRKEFKRYAKKINVPVRRKEITPKSIVEKFLYAVCQNNIFYTFSTEKEMNSFIQGVKSVNSDADIKLQKITVLED